MVRQRAHQNKGLRGSSMGSTRDKTKIVFFRAVNLGYTNMLASILSPSIHRSFHLQSIDPFAFNPPAAWEHTRIRFNGNIYTVRFISTTDHRIARATLERTRARASSYERAAEWETFVSFLFFVSPSSYTKLK